MNLLAIDSSFSILSAAVSKADEIFYTEIEAGVKHSEFVMGIIDRLVEKAGLSPENLDGVLCMGGPGSFTGLRIAYSIAKGLALSLSIPFIPFPTLDCIAFPYRDKGLTLAAMESRKNAWFFAVYSEGKPLFPVMEGGISQITEEIGKLNLENKENLTITGPGAASISRAIPEEAKKGIIFNEKVRGYAGELITIAKTLNLIDNCKEEFLYSGPDYIRKTDAELNLA